LAIADDLELARLAHLRVRREPLQLTVVVDHGTRERHDDVVLLKTRGRSGTSRIHARDDRPARVAQPERLHQLAGQGLHRDADPAPRHLAAVDQLPGDALDDVRGNGEADTLAGGHDGRVDADDLAAKIHEGAARVAGIDRRVGLDEVLVGGDADVTAPGRTHDADRDGLVEPEWVANRDGPLADTERVGIPEPRHRQLDVRLEPDHGQ